MYVYKIIFIYTCSYIYSYNHTYIQDLPISLIMCTCQITHADWNKANIQEAEEIMNDFLIAQLLDLRQGLSMHRYHTVNDSIFIENTERYVCTYYLFLYICTYVHVYIYF